MTTILAIDQGTSGTKAVVVDPEGSVLGLGEVPIRPDYRPGGIVEQDPEALWESVLAAARIALDQARVPIDGVALANQGETVLAWDPATGRPLSPLVVWQDSRAQSVCDELTEHADLIAERTGLVLDPYFTAPKLAWVRRHLTHEGIVTSSDAWLAYRLTGQIVSDISTASRSLLTRLDTLDYDPQLVDLFGLDADALPRIVANDEIIGSTTLFGDEVPVGGLVVDQQAALLAQRCLAAGEAKCTFGTGAFLLANLGQHTPTPAPGQSISAAWRVDGQSWYCSDGQVFTAASAIRWLTDLRLLRDARELDEIAGDDAHGVQCVPALAGLGAPWWRADATATLTGMTLGTTRAHLVTAVLQGLAAQVAELGDLVATQLGEPLQRLRVDGGLTRSTRFMQAVADLTAMPVDVYPSAHATPLGAVALMRKALAPATPLADAIVPWEPAACLAPTWSADRAGDFRSRWRATVALSLGDSATAPSDSVTAPSDSVTAPSDSATAPSDSVATFMGDSVASTPEEGSPS